jgi:hypothetical protein
MTAKPFTAQVLRRQRASLLAFRALADLLAEEAAGLRLPAAVLAAHRGTGLPPMPADQATPWPAAGGASTVAAAVLADRQRQPNPGLPGPLPRALRPVRLEMQRLPNRTRRSLSGTGSTGLSAAASLRPAAPASRRAAGSAPTAGSPRPTAAVARGGHASRRAAARSSAAAPSVPRRARQVLPSPPPAPRASQLPTARTPSAPNTTSPRLPTAAGLPADRRSLLPGFQERSDVHVASVRVDGLRPGSLPEARGSFSGSAERTDQ